MMETMNRTSEKVACINRKARYDFEIFDTIEAGLILKGSEAKALREGKGNLVDAYAMLSKSGALLHGFEISSYSHDTAKDIPSRRSRGLLLHRAEIRKVKARMQEKGLTLVPLRVYFKGPWAKVELGLARGKRKSDKRQSLRAKAVQRDVEQAYRRH
ncbi:MAG: SsrA-binding protein [Pseudohongiellaceae bacterium]|jgi:SsrA-binding protein